MTDLRNRIADFDQVARRILNQPPKPVLVAGNPATCHPGRPVTARGLCHSCYELNRINGTLHRYPTLRTQRRQPEFVADYQLLRSEGYTRRQIAERLGMKYPAVTRAYQRAINAGKLTPDRRTI